MEEVGTPESRIAVSFRQAEGQARHPPLEASY